MALKEQLQRLATKKDFPCVTISLNTHRTHPDSTKDSIALKNLLNEAQDRVSKKFDKRSVSALLEKIETVASEIDVRQNLDSLHIFLSNNTKKIIRTSWKTSNEGVHITDKFALRSIIKSYNRSENYLIMLLSQSGVQLYEAINDGIVEEIINEDFPFTENPHYVHDDKRSDPKHLDNLIREFFNKVDKALVKVYNETDLNCIVICTEDNFSKLQQVADRPAIYIGFSPINYNDTTTNQIVKQSWEIVKATQKQRRTSAIEEMKAAIAHGKVLTDLQEIYRAAIDGRGELLIVHQNFTQPVIMKDKRTFKLTDNPAQESAIDDITSTIAWEVISKKGRVFFTSQDEIKDLGKIVLKTRY